MKYALQRVSSVDCDRMALEVWSQLAGCCDECECQLFELCIACFCVEQRFAHIVDWELLAILFSYEHSADCAVGDCEVDVKLFPILWLGEEWGVK